MAVSKVVYGDTTLMDVSEDTVTADSLLSGVTATASNGEKITGSLTVKDYTAGDGIDISEDDVISTETRVIDITQTEYDALTDAEKNDATIFYNITDADAEGVTEQTVADWGFTKNTGDYSKPSTGIPKSDLASSVQTSLGKADTALQSFTESDPTVPSFVKAITQANISSWNSKQDALSEGDGIDITNNVISTETRIIDILQADYDALSDEEKASTKVFYNITDADGGADTTDCYKTTDTESTDIADTDYIPLSDASGNKKKSLWSNIKTVLSDMFKTQTGSITYETTSSGGTTYTLTCDYWYNDFACTLMLHGYVWLDGSQGWSEFGKLPVNPPMELETAVLCANSSDSSTDCVDFRINPKYGLSLYNEKTAKVVYIKDTITFLC